MGSIVSKLADEIALHGSFEDYQKFKQDNLPEKEIIAICFQQPNPDVKKSSLNEDFS